MEGNQGSGVPESRPLGGWLWELGCVEQGLGPGSAEAQEAGAGFLLVRNGLNGK